MKRACGCFLLATRRRDAGESAAFIAPDLLPRLVDEARAAFERELVEERTRS